MWLSILCFVFGSLDGTNELLQIMSKVQYDITWADECNDHQGSQVAVSQPCHELQNIEC